MKTNFWISPLFVVLWSTGFVGAKYGLPYAEPLTYLSWRFGIVLAILLAWMGFWRLRRKPVALVPRAQWVTIAWIGALNHGGYLGAVFIAISWGLEAGVSALIAAGLGPIFTAFFSRWRFGERLTASQWWGMALGLLGVALVVWRKLQAGVGDVEGAALCVFGALCFALGAIEQRRLGVVPMASGNAIQYLSAIIVVFSGALLLETGEIDWSIQFSFALAWQVLVLSIGAVSLYYLLLRHGAASEASSLLFLAPASAAIIAWPVFGEVLRWLEILGFAVAALGVALVMKKIGTV